MDGSRRETAQEDGCDPRAQARGDSRGPGHGARCHELRENDPWRCQGSVTDILVQEGQLWPFLTLVVGSGVLVTKIGEARKLVKGVE